MTIKKIFLISIVFSFISMMGSAFAADMFTISGTVSEISTYPNMIVIDEGGALTEVYGIKFNYLEQQYNIIIEPGMDVSVEAFEYLCSDGTTLLKAASITIGDATIELTSGGSGNGRNKIN